MDILLNFDSTQNIGDSRAMYISKKFEEAYTASANSGSVVRVIGNLYQSDINLIRQITNGLAPVSTIPIFGGKLKSIYEVSANPPDKR